MKKIFVLLTLVSISVIFITACRSRQPKNEIWYTSKDGTIVEPSAFGANIVSNTYQDGKGVIVFDNNEKYIGHFDFSYNRNLTSISLPEDVTTINESSFRFCTNLSSITIPWSVTEIGAYAFSNCSSLTSIIIPDNVVKIGECAFYNCTSLTSIYCKSPNPPTLGNDVFLFVAPYFKLYVPTTSVETYKVSEGWRQFYSNIVGYDFTHKATNEQSDSRKNEQYDPTEEYDVMIEEFALKIGRLENLILDASDSNHPFAYTKQIETLAAECDQLHKKLKAAPLDSRQRLYVNEIYADLEDLIRRLTWN